MGHCIPRARAGGLSGSDSGMPDRRNCGFYERARNLCAEENGRTGCTGALGIVLCFDYRYFNLRSVWGWISDSRSDLRRFLR